MEASQSPTPAEQQQAAEVSTAAGQAIAETVEKGGTEEEARAAARSAVETAASKTDLPVSKEQLFEMVDIMLDRMREMGVFEAPPASSAAATAAPAAAATAETPEAAAAAEAAAAEVTPPTKTTWAERFAGLK